MEALGGGAAGSAQPRLWLSANFCCAWPPRSPTTSGFSLIERGDADAAEAFHQARRIDPDNISALLNLLTIAQANDRPELPEYQAEWEAFKEARWTAA
jgi:hypothetical protein